MTSNQISSEAEFAPQPVTKASQHQKILDTIERQGFISKWGAIYDVQLHCSKLSTRIGEIEDRCGHKFQRERMYQHDGKKKYFVGMKYSIPQGLTIKDFRYGSR